MASKNQDNDDEIWSDEESDSEESIYSDSSTDKRGRPRIPEQWTKCISLEHDELTRAKTHVLANDLKLAAAFPKSIKKGKNKIQPHFISSEFLKDCKEPKLTNFMMNSD